MTKRFRDSGPVTGAGPAGPREGTSAGDLYERAVARVLPPAIVVRADDRVAYLAERARSLLCAPGTEPGASLREAFGAALGAELAALSSRARAEGRAARATVHAAEAAGSERPRLDVEAHPAREPGAEDLVVLVLYEREAPPADGDSPDPAPVPQRGAEAIEARPPADDAPRGESERRHLEEELRRRSAELAEANTRKDEYLAMLGHELRNPLAAIRSAGELLRLAASSDARARRACDVLERQCAHMTRLVAGLLDVSRIARGKLELEIETVDARRIVRTVTQDRETDIAAKELAFEASIADEALWVRGDWSRLLQVFNNLIDNAIKFTDAGGRVEVACARRGDRAAVEIRDTGAGFAEAVRARIFEAFHQGDRDPSRSSGGLGLGLPLAKGIVELHGGGIEAASAGRGRGATFRVTLPLATAPASRARERRPSPGEPRRVLLVEDRDDTSQMVRELLESQGHEVETARSVPEGLAALRERDFDIVLCDLGLPDQSGYELARAIREAEDLPDLPLIALTGYGQQQDRARSAEVGFDDHLTKPVELHTLLDTLRRTGLE